MTYAWRTLPDGAIEVDTHDGRGPHLPLLNDANAATFKRAVFDRWEKLARTYADAWRIPLHWILGMIWRESGGNPNALGHDPGGTTGYGLMQLTSSAARDGVGPPQILDPETNVRLGVQFIAKHCNKTDLPRCAASFNAGSVRHSDKSPWGMVETPGHVTSVVQAANTALRMLAAKVLDNTSKDGSALGLALAVAWWLS